MLGFGVWKLRFVSRDDWSVMRVPVIWRAMAEGWDYVLAGVDSCVSCQLRCLCVFYECLFIFIWMYSERWFGRLFTPLAKVVSLGSVVLCMFCFETNI